MFLHDSSMETKAKEYAKAAEAKEAMEAKAAVDNPSTHVSEARQDAHEARARKAEDEKHLRETASRLAQQATDQEELITWRDNKIYMEELDPDDEEDSEAKETKEAKAAVDNPSAAKGEETKETKEAKDADDKEAKDWFELSAYQKEWVERQKHFFEIDLTLALRKANREEPEKAVKKRRTALYKDALVSAQGSVGIARGDTLVLGRRTSDDSVHGLCLAPASGYLVVGIDPLALASAQGSSATPSVEQQGTSLASAQGPARFLADMVCSYCAHRAARVFCRRCRAPLCTVSSCSFQSSSGEWLCNFPNCLYGQYYDAWRGHQDGDDEFEFESVSSNASTLSRDVE